MCRDKLEVLYRKRKNKREREKKWEAKHPRKHIHVFEEIVSKIKQNIVKF